MVRFFISLRFRLILLVMVALLPALGAIVYNAMQDRREAMAAAHDQLRRLVALVAREQAQKTMAARHLLMGLAQTPAVRRQDAPACSALFARMISKPSLFINIGAIYPDGNILASGVPMPKPLNTKHLRYFQKALETRDFAVGNLQIGRIVLQPVLIFSYPVLDMAGEVQTVLYASVRLDWLNHLAAQARLPAGSVLTIIDDHGTIMAKYPETEKWAGKSLPPGGLIDIIRKHGQGIAEAQGMDGLPRLFAFMPLEGDPQLGFVFAGIPTRVVYAAADQTMRRNLAVLGGVLLLALGFAWGFGRLLIMRRINPLVQTTARLAAGDLAARTGLAKGPDELGQLAQAFDQMAASLEAREAERRQAEAEIKGDEARSASLLRISQYPAASIRELLDYVLSEAITLTGSTMGYFYQYDEATRQFTLISYSKQVMLECSVSPKDLYKLEKAGIWGEAVRQRRPIIVNDFQAPHPLKKGYPEEHPELYNYLTIPIFTDRRIVGVVGVANKSTDYDESDVLQLTLMMESVWQIAERRRTEEALRESEARFQALFEQAAVGAAQVDTVTGRFVRINRKFCDIVGYTREEMERLDFQSLTHPDDLPADLANMERLKAGEIGEFTREKRYFRQDGAIVWVSLTVSPMWAPGAPPDYHIAVVQDITARKEAEAALRQSEERLRLKLDSILSPDVDIVDQDLSNILDLPAVQSLMEDFTKLTDMAIAILDLKGNVLVATGWQDICTQYHRVHPETERACTASDLFLAQHLKAGEYVAYKCKNHLWDVVTPLFIGEKHVGKIFTGQFFYADEAVDEQIFIDQAAKYGFDQEAYLSALRRVPRISREQVKILMDFLVKFSELVSKLSYSNINLAKAMFEQQRAEEEILRFASFPRLNPNPVLEVDLDGKVTYGNESAYEALRKLGRQDITAFLPPDLEALIQSYREKGVKRFFREVKIDGAVFAETIHVAEEFKTLRLFAIDITAHKQAEAERDRLFNHSLDILCIGGFDGFFKQVNPAGEKLLGWTDQELLRKPWIEFVHPEDRAATIAAGERLAAGEAVYGFENRYQCRDGSYRWFSWNAFPLLEEGLIFCIARDVTARKQAEEALRQSEELYHSLFENMLNGFAYCKMLFEHDQPQDFIYLEVNSSFEALTGLKDVVGKKVSEVIPGMSEADPGLLEIYGRVALTGKPERFEIFLEALEMWFAISVYSPAKEYFVAVFDVITERKQAEAALRESEERLRLALAAANQGLYDLNIQTGEAIVSPEYARQLGYEPETFVETNEKWIERLHPDDREEVAANYRAYVKGEIPEYRVEFRQRTKSGDWKWILSLGKIVDWDAEGRPLRMLGTHTDISERKQAEEELVKNLAILNEMGAIARIGGWEHNLITAEATWTEALYDIAEFESGRPPGPGEHLDYYPPKDRAIMAAAYQRARETGEPFDLVLQCFSAIHRPFWARVVGRPVFYNGKCIRMVGTFQDITELKQAEAALQQRFHDLATLYAASQAFLGQIGVAATSQATCRLAVEHFGLRMAWVGLVHPGDYLVHPAASFGVEAGYLDAVRITWDDSPTGRGPTGTAIRTRQPFIINNIETDAAFAPWREAAQARGYRSSLAIPLCTDDEVMGALNLYSEQEDFFQPDRLPVLQAFTNQLAVALQKARLYEEIQRHAAALEDRVAERTARLQATNLELDRFAYSVSHDLRAPLRAMQGFSQALLEDYAGELDPGGQGFARRINAAAERMDHLIQDLLAYSRLSREEMALQPVSLEQTVAEALAHLEADIRARQARVRVEPPLLEVQAHHVTLLQVVANLVSNAIKFTAPDVQPQVRLWAEDRGERMRLWVEDNGLGIAPEHQERIFRIFERLHGVEAYPGTGIGLAIVKKGVERMGGQVEVESAPGQGSRFWVELGKAV